MEEVNKVLLPHKNMEKEISAKPFVKWAGGKRQLIRELISFVPNTFGSYFEPFLGGGALFFEISKLNKISNCFLNDSNEILINAYGVIKDHPDKLILELKKKKYKNEKKTFLKIRAEEPSNEIESAARFIYLNRTAFNGLYRVNSNGKFNVPFGKYANPKICDEKNILKVSKALQKDELTSIDFKKAVKKAKKGDFIYFDPPYAPLNKTSSFTSYTKNNFTEKDQKRLAKTFEELGQKGCFVMLSNSYTPLILNLYKGYYIHAVKATRRINCKAKGRGKIKEVIITNYNPDKK